MHILFVSENFPPETNAAANRVYERALYWVEWGHEVTILTCALIFPDGKLLANYKNRWYQTELMSGIRVVRVKTFIAANQGVFFRSIDFLSFLFSAFAGGLVQQKPDIIISTSPQFFSAVAGWALSVCKRTPFVFELGDLWPNSISAVGAIKNKHFFFLMEKIELFLYRRSKAVVALTTSFKKNLVSRRIQEEKIHVIINGVDLHRYGPSPRDIKLTDELALTNKFVLGYLGTHGMAHGLVNVLDAAETLQDLAHIRFLFVGAGAERKFLVEEARRRKLKNVIFVSSKPKEEMRRFWSLCDLALVHLRDSITFSEVSLVIDVFSCVSIWDDKDREKLIFIFV